MDLGDLLILAGAPTSDMLVLSVDEEGIAHFRLPRAEVGQGITTAVAQIVAEELDARLDDVDVVLEDARPELLFNQLTGGSNTIHALYGPLRRGRRRRPGPAGHRRRPPLGTARRAPRHRGDRGGGARRAHRRRYGSAVGRGGAA